MIDDKMVNVLKIRAFALKTARRWFDDNGYVEVQAPILLPVFGKSPNSFKVKYYDRSAYLTKGFLPYGKVFADKLEKVYTVTPSFRKEQTTNRHLSEYWRIEVAQKGGLNEIINVQEKIISSICSSLSSDFKEMLGYFSRPWRDLEKVRIPFNRLFYDQAIKSLQNDGHKIWWGQEIAWELERHISFTFDKPFFITKYPFTPAAFLSETDPEKPELSLTADLLAPEGYGEIASSAQILNNSRDLTERLKDIGVSRKDQEWFRTLINSSSCSYSCSAIGIERLLQWICKISNINETNAYPRTTENIYP